jgi:hypothetical protein
VSTGRGVESGWSTNPYLNNTKRSTRCSIKRKTSNIVNRNIKTNESNGIGNHGLLGGVKEVIVSSSQSTLLQFHNQIVN